MSTLDEKARKAYFKIKKTIGLNNPCNPNLLMHEIIFLINTFDFQVALSISWDRVSLEEMT
jgi:hypothetical protein